MPPTIWRPKVISKYTTPEYSDDGLYDILNYSQYGKCVYQSKLRWDTGNERSYRIYYNATTHTMDSNTYLRLGKSLESDYQVTIRNLIIKYCDCFAKEGAKRLILGYEFRIDTSGAKPECC